MTLSETVAQAKQRTEAARASLLGTFAFVPDEKLRWSPSESARSALQIVAHCGMANRAFAGLLRGESLPLADDPAEAARQIRAAGRDVATREAATALLEGSTAEVQAALDAVTPELAASSPSSPFGPMPYAFWMTLSAEHMAGHVHQIAYLQTVWGDLDDH